jgi:CheY-like chemotaxis protein
LSAALSARALVDPASIAITELDRIVLYAHRGIELLTRPGGVPLMPPPVAPGAEFSGHETLLFVEDNETILTLVTSALRRLGYRVLTATNGLDAVNQFGESDDDIALLVTDVMMPKLSGRELAARMASLRPSMKVLYASGYTDDAMIQLGLQDGAHNFIQKPYTPVALAARIRQLLDE